MPQAGDGVDPGRNAAQTGSQRAIDHAFDGEVVNEVGVFTGVQAGYLAEQAEFPRWVEAAPVHRDSEGAETGGLQASDVGAGRGQHDDFVALLAQIMRQWEAEVIDIPIGVGEEKNLFSHLRFLATIPTPIPKQFGKKLNG